MTSPSTDRRYGVNSGLGIKAPVLAASTANLTLSGEQTVDGTALVTGNRVLVKNQTATADNGIYVVDTGAWTRDLDFDGNRDIAEGTLVNVVHGSVNANTIWRVATASPVIGSAITFAQNNLSSSDSSSISYTPSGSGASVTNVQTKLRRVVDVMDKGAVADDATNDGAAFNYAMAEAVRVNVPAGTYLIQTQLVFSGAKLICGDGKGVTILHAKGWQAVSTLFSLTQSKVTFRDMTIKLDLNGHTTVRAISFDSAGISNITFEDVEFTGTGSATGHVGLWVNGYDFTNLYCRRCDFTLLDFCIAKDNADTSTQQNTVFSDCRFYQCTDGLEFNSPVGTWTDISVTDSYFEANTQFPIGIAGTNTARISIRGNHFYNHVAQQVHIEAGAHEISIIGNSFSKGNTSGALGNVHVVAGAHTIQVVGNSFDLTQSGTPRGIYFEAGGGATPFSLTVSSNSFLCNANTTCAIYVSLSTEVLISNNLFSNPSSASKCTSFIQLVNCSASGNGNSFYNPKNILAIDDNCHAALDNSRFDGDFTNFAFTTGSTNTACNVSWGGFRVYRAFTANAAADWQTICPSGSLYDGVASIRYVGSGASDAFTKTVKLLGDSGSLTLANTQSNAVGGVNPDPSAPDVRDSGGSLQARCFRATTQNGNMEFQFSGVWFA